MDFSESTKIVFNRIKKLEPENVTKIIGYLLLQDRGDQEIIHLATSPDSVIEDVIYKAKSELQQLALKSAPTPVSPSMNSPPVSDFSSHFNPFTPVSPRPMLSLTSFPVQSPYWEPQVTTKHSPDFMSIGYLDSMCLEDQMESLSLGNTRFSSDCYYPDVALSNVSARTAQRHATLNEFPVKTCHYFNKGFCKHGSNCRYFHGQVSESFPQLFCHNSIDSVNEDHIFSPVSLEKLELEIIELLKLRRGNPVSIASLPMIYYEKYGKVLQADGYLTESQRHGKAGYSLTKLLARLKNSIRLIDRCNLWSSVGIYKSNLYECLTGAFFFLGLLCCRPHGQHAVILAEDAHKYMESRNDRNDPGPIVSGSRQIYLTFPAESTFTEDDVSNYFSTFGLVEDVRIPCQQKRMFGFVTFVSAETVKMILAKGNPHFVCGARVLVKPYREKSKLVDRKYQERFESYYTPHYVDMDSEIHSLPRGYETSKLLRKQLMEQHEQTLELERRHLAEMQLARKPLANDSYFGYSMDGLKVSEDHLNFPSAERFSYLLDVLNNGSSTDDKIRHTDTTCTDQESEVLNLPESPFASAIASSISMVI
ncbi:RRM_6 domain-containing protein [Cephalotus follicularis]|uniref:RRM_6 domain-containing protein n=1 Tax=Cephalotus follicularis TaxID=3775 RepID=A0A1Q3D351_CEPFO|nr:RRM_6 domain-containing protein [Cephalotus follicularis]